MLPVVYGVPTTPPVYCVPTTPAVYGAAIVKGAEMYSRIKKVFSIYNFKLDFHK